MFQQNGSGPQINGGPRLDQPQNIYGGGAPSHAQTLADLVAQYRAKPAGPQVNPGPSPVAPVQQPQPGQQRGQMLGRFREHRGLGRLFGSYFQ